MGINKQTINKATHINIIKIVCKLGKWSKLATQTCVLFKSNMKRKK